MTAGGRREPRESTKDHWKRILEDWVASGMDERDYCRRSVIPITKFRWWRKRLRPEHAVPTPFVSVRVKKERSVPISSVPIEIVFPRDRIVRVRPGFDEETLARIVQILEAPPCG